LQNKTGLRHGPFKGIDQQQHAIGHVENAFHFPTKVRMPRCVDDVDFYIFISYGNVFREDGNAPFTLQIIGVEDQILYFLVLTEKFNLMEDAVYHGGFAVVHMSDESYVSDVLHGFLSDYEKKSCKGRVKRLDC